MEEVRSPYAGSLCQMLSVEEPGQAGALAATHGWGQMVVLTSGVGKPINTLQTFREETIPTAHRGLPHGP